MRHADVENPQGVIYGHLPGFGLSQVGLAHADEVSLLISHADPLQAAWILLDGRPQNEREMYHKQVDKAAILQLDLEGDRVLSTRYVPPPQPQLTLPL